MAKTKKVKIPKRIAGVKLPKDLRRKGEAILDKANSPAGREMIAAGLTMAAAAATAAVARTREKSASAATAAPATPGETAANPQPTSSANPNPQVIVDTIGNMADMLLGRMFGPKKAD